MAISFVGSAGTNGATASGNFTLTSPTGTAAGDVLIILVAEHQAAEGISGISNGTHSFTNFGSGGQGSSAATSLWRYVVQAGDGTTWTLTNTSAGCEAVIVCYRGVDTTTPIDVSGTTNTALSATATFASVTTVTANAWYVGGFAGNLATATALSSLSSGSPTPNIRADAANGGSTTTRQDVALIDVAIASPGATGTFVYNLSFTDRWATDCFALRPAATFTPLPDQTNQPYPERLEVVGY